MAAHLTNPPSSLPSPPVPFLPTPSIENNLLPHLSLPISPTTQVLEKRPINLMPLFLDRAAELQQCVGDFLPCGAEDVD